MRRFRLEKTGRKIFSGWLLAAGFALWKDEWTYKEGRVTQADCAINF